MSIYTNSKQFSKYLINKAKELGVTIKELRRQVAIDLEVPAAEGADYSQAFEEPIDPEDLAFYHEFVELLTPEEREYFDNSIVVKELMLRALREAYAMETVQKEWVKSSLRDCLMRDEEPESEWFTDWIQELINWGITMDWDKEFTEKDYRQLSLKLKALSRNPDGTIKDERLLGDTETTLSRVYNFFTDYQFCNN
jgi:hypothetical protein